MNEFLTEDKLLLTDFITSLFLIPFILKVTINPSPTENIIPDTLNIVEIKDSPGLKHTNEDSSAINIKNNVLTINFIVPILSKTIPSLEKDFLH